MKETILFSNKYIIKSRLASRLAGNAGIIMFVFAIELLKFDDIQFAHSVTRRLDLPGFTGKLCGIRGDWASAQVEIVEKYF
jgi:hypothetical protein